VQDLRWLDTLEQGAATGRPLLVMGLLNGMGRDNLW